MSKKQKQVNVVPKGKADRGGSQAAKAQAAEEKKALVKEADDELEVALEESFPASDPVAMVSTLVPGSRH